jgi:hypothetical protein
MRERAFVHASWRAPQQDADRSARQRSSAISRQSRAAGVQGCDRGAQVGVAQPDDGGYNRKVLTPDSLQAEEARAVVNLYPYRTPFLRLRAAAAFFAMSPPLCWRQRRRSRLSALYPAEPSARFGSRGRFGRVVMFCLPLQLLKLVGALCEKFPTGP